MQNTHATRPWAACACALVLGIAGITGGIVVQLPAAPSDTGLVKTAKAGVMDTSRVEIAPQLASADDVKPFADRKAASHTAASPRPE